MYEMMLNRKHNRKGFTLVEVIVVLVILAILAAIMIPSMVKWIDEANSKAVLVEARTALLAAQTIASELYANATTDYKYDKASIAKLSGLPEANLSNIGTWSTTTGAVTGFVYTKGGRTATWNGSAWELGGGAVT